MMLHNENYYDLFYYTDGKVCIVAAKDSNLHSKEDGFTIESYMNHEDVAKCPICSYFFFETSDFEKVRVYHKGKQLVMKPDCYLYFRLEEDVKIENLHRKKCPICYLGRNVGHLPMF